MTSTTSDTDTALTPDQLKTDLKQLCSDIIRETYLASQKLLAYPLSYPTRKEAVNSAFLHLKSWLQFKFYYQIETDGKNLWTEKIMLENDNFVRNFISLLKKHGLEKVRFYDWITTEELYVFLDSLNFLEEDIVRRLYQQNITSIEISPLIQEKLHFIADRLMENYTVENLAEEELKINPSLAIKIIIDKFEEGKIETSFRKEVLYSVAGKFFAGLSPSSICRLIEQELKTDTVSPGFVKIVQQVAEHPQGKSLMLDLERILEKTKLSPEAYRTYFEKCASYPLEESSQDLSKELIAAMSEDDFLFFLSSLLKTGGYDKLRLMLNGLVKQLVSESITTRSRSLSLVKSTTGLLMAEQALFSYLNGSLIESWDKQKQTFEILDALCFLAEKSLAHQCYREFKVTLDFLKRKTEEETSIYRQGVFRKVLDRLTNTKVVNRLIGDMNESDEGKIFQIGECLKSINTREAAERLNRMINHPQAVKRRICLNALAEMGDQGIGLVSEILAEEEFATGLKRKKLGHKNRARVFEIVWVLGKNKSQKAIELLERLSKFEDIEVRLKIASTLKNFEDPKALTLLRRLAVGAEPKIRREAVCSLKDKISSRDLEWLKSIYFEDDDNLGEVACAIGNLKTGEGDRFLLAALTQDKRLKKDPLARIRILEVLSNRGKVFSKEQIWRLKYRLKKKTTSPLIKLILKRRVNQLVRQIDE